MRQLALPVCVHGALCETGSLLLRRQNVDKPRDIDWCGDKPRDIDWCGEKDRDIDWCGDKHRDIDWCDDKPRDID